MSDGWLSKSEQWERDNFHNEWKNEERVVAITEPGMMHVASEKERLLRRAVAVLTEIQTGMPIDPEEFNCITARGIDLPVSTLAGITKILYEWFDGRSPDTIQAMSLEAQIWWRDYQKAEVEVIKREMQRPMSGSKEQI